MGQSAQNGDDPNLENNSLLLDRAVEKKLKKEKIGKTAISATAKHGGRKANTSTSAKATAIIIQPETFKRGAFEDPLRLAVRRFIQNIKP